MIVGAACVGVYASWFLLRLLSPKNLAAFRRKPIPPIRRAGAGGLGVQFGDELADLIPAFEQQTAESFVRHDERISKLEAQMDLWEDVSGRA